MKHDVLQKFNELVFSILGGNRQKAPAAYSGCLEGASKRRSIFVTQVELLSCYWM